MAKNYIRTEDNEYINIDYIVGVQQRLIETDASNVAYGFDIHMEDEAIISCSYTSAEEANDKFFTLLQEVSVRNRWLLFEEYGLAVKANVVKYIKNENGGIVFATEDRKWSMTHLSNAVACEYREILLGRHAETELEKYGEYTLM